MPTDLPNSLRSPLLGLKSHKVTFAMNAFPRFGERSVELLRWGWCGLHGPRLGPDLTGPAFQAPVVSESAQESDVLSREPAVCSRGRLLSEERGGGLGATEGLSPI